VPFVPILNAAIILAGGAPKSEDGSGDDHKTIMGDPHSLAAKIVRELVLGATLGKINATLEFKRIDAWSTVDFDDARHFIVSRGLLLSELKPQREGTRAKQLRLLQEIAKARSFSLHAMSRLEYRQLKADCQMSNESLFSNFKDIWQAAKDHGIAKKIK
jgi:hypothetical protein